MMSSTIKQFGRRTRQAFSLAGLASSVLRRSAVRRFPALSVEERLAMLPATAPVDTSLAIRWNDNHIPFVEAGSDRDAAVGLGIVHGHLRLAQMELMRRIALGRVAEVAGSAAIELDRLVRLIDFPRATEASLALMPAATRAWVDGFADGINAAAEARLPPEFETLSIPYEPWTAEQLFAVSRLCSADYAWKVWRTLNPLREDPEWARMWSELIGIAAVADEDIPIGADNLEDALPNAFDRAGSNALAVAGSRTRSGVPMLACDPHHIITAPNLWLIAGVRTPEIDVWGFMIPALPIFGVGRNQHGAWGGTNLHATSSELVDVSAEPLQDRTIAIKAGKATHELAARESAFGPVVSDAHAFNMTSGTVALHWMGHRPSDEFTPFRNLMRASSWETFADAVDGCALPGLNMIWADPAGHIGKMVAAHIPSRPLATPGDLVVGPAEAHRQWARLLTGRELPMSLDPADGYVVSSNEAPVDPPVTISLFFAADHRFRRIGALLAERDDLTAADLKALQQDVMHAPALAVAEKLKLTASDIGLAGPVMDAIAAWDGRYGVDSAGALAFELVSEPLVETLEERSPQRFVSPYWRPFSRLERLVDAATKADLVDALKAAVESAAAPFETHRTWGGLHKVRLSHPFTKLPWLAARLPTIEFPSGGSNDTVMKSMHPFTQKVHHTNFGANARFVADLADEDGTWAVLLGGQDGWPGSRTMFDMLGAWRRGEQIRLPFSEAGLAEDFRHPTPIAPPAPAGPDA
ncbi:penicillin acylase family protein [Acuticoccus sp. I52.16.1]|uniref:penicillin acylase family protein n=1 Tax=Acuticoccus sp. I52.16.1 TaxID=2928472 RepID=UPI001FD32745|nr:penicillin acylase family protein [Acuticoccus sp. I52.16.1]UOM33231.1 penicillin acylase family protein [Acuticoccus sp. I52.16.1]